MITKIISCADIHVPSLRNIDDIKLILSRFIDECKNIVSDNTAGQTRIVIAGDIFDNKISITNESIIAVDWFFKELDNICTTYVIAGNHDLLLNNLDRVDSLSPLFEIGNYKNVHYLDKELNYKSGCIVDDDVVWCLYSTFDSFNRPDVKSKKSSHSDKTYVGLIHCDVNGAISQTNYVCENGIDPDVFEDLDFVIAGHIHKFQEIRSNGVPVVYCSSINQKNFGESITSHGYVLWSRNEENEFEYELTEIDNSEGGFFKFAITSIEDIKNDEEELINL